MLCVFASIGWCRTQNILSKSVPVLFTLLSAFFFSNLESFFLFAGKGVYTWYPSGFYLKPKCVSMVTMVTMGGDLQPGSLADRLLTGLGQPQINP